MKCEHCGAIITPYEDHYCYIKSNWLPTYEKEGNRRVYECPKCNWMVTKDEVDNHCPNCQAELQFP